MLKDHILDKMVLELRYRSIENREVLRSEGNGSIMNMDINNTGEYL